MKQTFDVMVRFPYLARKLQFQDLGQALVLACAVLHNLCIKWREKAEVVEEAVEVDPCGDEAPETSGSKSSFGLNRQSFEWSDVLPME